MQRASLRLYSASSALPAVGRITKTFQLPPPSLSPAEDSSSASFSSSLYFSHLNKHGTSGRVLLHAEELGSTQTLVMETPDCDESVVCVADRQVQGKGRGENTWESPPGCLMFSFRSSFPSQHGRLLPFFQYLVSLALVRSCRKSMPQGQNEVQIKWPNDIYASKTYKIGGVLCQSSFNDGRFIVTTGVGLNVENELPTTCLSALAKERVRREVVLANFFNEFDDLYAQFLHGGNGEPSFAPLLPEYLSLWLHTGQRVAVDAGAKQVTITGISCATAALTAVDDAGHQVELHPDGNRLDFFKGLVSKKM